MINKNTIKLAIVITAVFTILDYIVHYFGFLVPGLDYLSNNYFINKIIFLPVIIYLLIEFFKVKGYMLYVVTAIALQVRYYFSYLYDIKTNLTMLVVHYVLLIISYKLLEVNSIRRIVKI